MDSSLSPGQSTPYPHCSQSSDRYRGLALVIESHLTDPRLSVHPDCVSAFNDLKLHKGGAKYIIYKISDDQKEIVVEEVGKDHDYNVFREKLTAAKEKNGKSRPSYAIYDIEFELEGGEGKRLAPSCQWDEAHAEHYL
jgi:hypothetical protein